MWRPDRRAVLAAAVMLPGMTLVPARADTRSRLAFAAAAGGRRFGMAVRWDRLDDRQRLRRAVDEDCDWITPEFDWNWNALEPERGRWWFRRGDAIARFARQRGLETRGHVLVWEQSTPAWARAEMESECDWRLIERWFDGVIGRYGAETGEWSVVNEAIDTENGDADGLRRTCFHRSFGAEYVGRAFRTAKAMAPTVRLVLNEYGLEYGNAVESARRTAFLKLIERLRRDGVPVDGIGLQAHLDLRKGPLDTRAIAAMLREIAGMGLTVTITELDVMEADRSRPLAERDQAVADAMRAYLDVALAEPAVRGVTLWGVSDADSWLQTEPGAEPGVLNRGLLYDERVRAKPAHAAVTAAFAAVPARV